MKPSGSCLKIIKQFEGCRLKAYLDPVGIPTIGWGSIRYPDGAKVKIGDKITQDRADQMLSFEVEEKSKSVWALVKDTGVNQFQFDALVSFAYNVGAGALKKSTLLKKLKANPDDPAIEEEFMKWVKAGGVVLNGLKKRRQAEADLYFS